MKAIPDGLTFDPENRGWENIRAWYRGEFVGDVHACRDRKRGWRVSIYCGPRDLNLGIFDSRDEGKQAIIDWFRGMEIEEWSPPQAEASNAAIRHSTCRMFAVLRIKKSSNSLISWWAQQGSNL